MPLRLSAAAALTLLITGAGGCGGERGPGAPGAMPSSARTFVLFQMKGDDADPSTFPVDTSRLPPDAVQRVTGTPGEPKMIGIRTGYGVRVVLVPATQP